MESLLQPRNSTTPNLTEDCWNIDANQRTSGDRLNMWDFLANSSWRAQESQSSLDTVNNLPYGDIFNPEC